MKTVFKLLIISVLVSVLTSCKPATTVIIQQPVPTTNAPIYASTSSVSTSSAPTSPPTTTRWNWQPSPGNIVAGGKYAYFPANGAYVQAGRTLSLSWSADSDVECFILTQNQYNNFRPLGIVSASMAHGQGPSGTVIAYVQNSDVFYAIVRNNDLTTSVKLYQATLTEQ